MRIRKKKWVDQELQESSFYISNPFQNIGNWKKQFKKDQEIHLELGCGKGIFISQLASKNPQINYIAIDIKSEMLGLTKRNIEKEYKNKNILIENILITSQEIMIIDNIFNEKDVIDRIYINFCNPWPKPKHKKRRLTHTNQLEKYKKFLRQNGEIYFKTDDEQLFKDSIKYFEETDFKITKKTEDLHLENVEGNIETEHEKMFSNKGIKIKALVAKRIF